MRREVEGAYNTRALEELDSRSEKDSEKAAPMHPHAGRMAEATEAV